MGFQTSVPQVAYSLPLPGTKQKGFSSIYRCPKAINGLISTSDPTIKSYKDLIYRCHQKFKNKHVLGQIYIKNMEKDGKIAQQREMIKFTYDQLYKMSQKIGSFLFTNKLYFAESEKEMKLIGIFSKNRYQWAVSDLGCILYGLTSVPLYQTLGKQNLKYCLEHSQVTTLFVTADAIKSILSLSGLGKLQNLISYDPLPQQTIQKIKNKNLTLYYFNQILKSTQKISDHIQITSNLHDCLTFSYTSGTTGPPKCAMISHGNIISILGSLTVHQSGGFNQNDSYVSFLPLAHVLQRDFVLVLLSGGAFVSFFSGDIMKMKDDLIYAKPTIFTAVPRLLNRVVEGVQKLFNQQTGFKKYLIQRAIKQKLKYLQETGDYNYPLYDKLVFQKVKQKFGGNIRLIVTGSAPIKKHTYEMMKILLSCPLYEAYGQTQNTGLGFAQETITLQPGHVGGIVGALQFKLCDVPQMKYTSQDKDEKGRETPRGQIWLRGAAVFLGYYKDHQKTKQTVTQDGWLKTGDIGMLMAKTNALKIIDRKKNIFKLQQGQYVAAQKVQAIYAKCPLVAETFLHGQSSQNYAIAIITPHKHQLIKLAENNKIQCTYEQLCKNRKIRQLICKKLDEIGKLQGLMSFQQAKNIYLQPQQFINLGIVSTTMKLQRFQAKKYYNKQIQQMYKEGPLIVK